MAYGYFAYYARQIGGRCKKLIERLIGGAILIGCTASWGKQASSKLLHRQQLTAALADFAEYCGERIRLFRDPLDVIYASFENDILAKEGFTQSLRLSGAAIAAASMEDKLLGGDAAVLREFSKKIGQGYSDEQAALCTFTASSLRESEKRQLAELPGKTRIYKLLPPLAAASAVILLI